MKSLQLTFICLLMNVFAYAQNPIIKDVGMSDPTILIDDDPGQAK